MATRVRACVVRYALAAATVCATGLLQEPHARAESATRPSFDAGEHVGYFSMDLGAGGYGTSDGHGMVELGLSARGRYDLFEAGIAIDGASEVLGGSMTGVGAVAGLTTTGAPHFRADVLGEVGVHDYENLGGFLANGVSGSSAGGSGPTR